MKPYKFIIELLLCGWAIGLGFRFVAEFIMGYPQEVWYQIVYFDYVFDWMMLMIFGIINAVLLFKDMRK